MGFSAVFEVCSAERLVANGVCGRIRKSSPPAFSDRQPSQFFLECFYGLDLDRLSQDGTLVTLLELFPSQDPQVRRNRVDLPRRRQRSPHLGENRPPGESELRGFSSVDLDGGASLLPGLAFPEPIQPCGSRRYFLRELAATSLLSLCRNALEEYLRSNS